MKTDETVKPDIFEHALEKTHLHKVVKKFHVYTEMLEGGWWKKNNTWSTQCLKKQ